MLLTIDQYINQYKDKLDKCTEPYLRNLSKPELKYHHIENDFLYQECYMLKWNESDASNWCGPFEENFSFCKIKNYDITNHRLKSMEEIFAAERKYIKYSKYSWKNLNILERILGKDWDICLVGNERCSRSELTLTELNLILSKATKEEIEKYSKVILSHELSFHYEEPSKETPVKLYLCGNDDVSYTKLFNTFEDAKNYLLNLEKENNFQIIERDFVFTN